jgi:nucleotide-binding universal stress UspA family protein
MAIIVGFTRASEGRAALDRAVAEALLRDADLVVIHSLKGGERDELEKVLAYREEFAALETELAARGVRFRLIEYARGNSPAEDLVEAAREHDGELIVIGFRRRSPVGKLVLGSNAQDVLMNAECPVLAVRVADDD